MKREIFEQLKKLVQDDSSKEVIIIEGARQVGKSYLVNDVLKNIKKTSFSFDLEKENTLRRKINATEDFNDFKTLMQDQYGIQKKSILFFDEAQECPKLAEYVKSFKEDWPEIKVVFTGSSMNRFFKKNQRIPVGRTKSLCLYPFSFLEFIKLIENKELYTFIKSTPKKITPSRHQYLLELYDKYLHVGGYPESVKAFKEGEDHIEIIDEIMGSLTEDFQRKEEFEPAIFPDIIKGVCNHIGSLSKLTQFGMKKYKIIKTIEAMKAWHIVIEVEQQKLEPSKSVLLPKRYLHDVGVVNRFRTITAPSISIINTLDQALRTSLGGLFENAVLLNLLKGSSIYTKIYGWKKGNNTDVEVDFILDLEKKNKMKVPVECKAALKVKSKHYTNIRHYLSLTKQKLGILISAAPFEVIQLKNNIQIINIPIYLATKDNIKNYINR